MGNSNHGTTYTYTGRRGWYPRDGERPRHYIHVHWKEGVVPWRNGESEFNIGSLQNSMLGKRQWASASVRINQ